MGKEISVVIPAYNEEKRLGPTLEKLRDYLASRFGDFELIVVDDGSTDGTAALVKRMAAEIPGLKLIENERNFGKGHSIKRGVLASTGDLVLTSDADMSTPIGELDKLIPFVSEGGCDIAIGSRGLKQSELLKRQPWYRERMGKAFNALVRLLLIRGIKDTQCGFKLFKREAAQRLFGLSLIRGFSFDAEILFVAGKSGMKIREVPVKWLNSPTSKVKILRDSSRMLIDLLRIRANWIRGRYRPSVL